jgi:glucose-6-phosphate dehydrogenase assembly protein OpcA
LLKELDQVWLTLGKETEAAGGVLRACAMTLITLLEDSGEAADVTETLADLVRDHPSRAIVVRVGAAARLEGRALAQCWMPFGRRQQICCEQIEISTPAEGIQEVWPVLRGLMVPDLPVVAWVHSPRLLEHAEVGAGLSLAHRVIVESRQVAAPASFIRRLSAIAAQRLVADLAWTRITRWRELIAQSFDSPALAGCVSHIEDIVVRHGGPQPGPAALYLGTWLAQSLRMSGANPKVRYETVEIPEATWHIRGVELVTDRPVLAVKRMERGLVQADSGAGSHCLVFRQLKESELMREELAMGPDPAFDRVLADVAG